MRRWEQLRAADGAPPTDNLPAFMGLPRGRLQEEEREDVVRRQQQLGVQREEAEEAVQRLRALQEAHERAVAAAAAREQQVEAKLAQVLQVDGEWGRVGAGVKTRANAM